jgi:hypothetical protein
MNKLQKLYFFLKRSTILKPSHKAPKHTKKKGTIPAANASMVILSITSGQLQFNPCIEVLNETGNAVFPGWEFSGILQICIVIQGMGYIDFTYNRVNDYLAKL